MKKNGKKNREKKWERYQDGTKRGRYGMRRTAAIFLCMAASVVYTACGAGDSAVSNGMKYESEGAYTTDSSFYGESYPDAEESYPDAENFSVRNSMGMENGEILDGRKLIETVNLEVETREFEQMMSVLEEQIRNMKGYIESMESYNGSSYSGYRSLRHANLTIRIPSGKLNAFLTAVSDAGNVVRSNKSVDDVTLSYVDMESRRNTLQKEQERLIAFLDRAETIEEIITIEERLSEVRYQLESMESQLRTIDNLVDYSTVYLDISEVEVLTPVEEPTVWERISEGFSESLYSVGNGAAELGIWILVHIPYLVIWGILIAGIVLLWRRQRRRKQKKLESRLFKPVPGPQNVNGYTDLGKEQDRKEQTDDQRNG